MEINQKIAEKVLSVVDKGLSSGLGVNEPGKMCVEAAVCYALDLPHSDRPPCVSPALRELKIRLNDANWSSPETRAKGLRRLALAQLGSAGALDGVEFAKRVAELSIKVSVPLALRAAAELQKDKKHQEALEQAALRCEKEGTKDAANAAYAAAYNAAYNAAYAAYNAAYAAYAAYAAKRDEVLSNFAEAVVQILIEMKAPGCQWLTLTE